MKMHNYTITFAVTLMLAACGSATDAPAPTSADDAPIHVSVDGRGDSNGLAVTLEEVDAVLDIANTYSFEELDALLDRRAAANIVEARADDPIASLAELDDVSYVGMRVFSSLLEEARSYLGIDADAVDFSVDDHFEVEEVEDRYRSSYRILVRGGLLDALRDQPFAQHMLQWNCEEDDAECRIKFGFTEFNDYSDEAGPGNVVASFRSDGLSTFNDRERNAFSGAARSIIESRINGPLQCKELDNDGPCIALYGGCPTQYRCSLRLPE